MRYTGYDYEFDDILREILLVKITVTYRSGKSANLTLSVIDKYALNNIKSEISDVFNAFFKIFVFNVRKTSEPAPFRKLEISLSAIEVDFPYLGTELNAVVTIHQWHNACSTRQYR